MSQDRGKRDLNFEYLNRSAKKSGHHLRSSIVFLLNVLLVICISAGTSPADSDKVIHQEDFAFSGGISNQDSKNRSARIEFYEPEKISNAPGYIVTDPKSGWFRGVTYSGHDSEAGVDIRTPPELLYRTSKDLLPPLIDSGGKVSHSAVTARKQVLAIFDMNLFIQECGDRDGKIIRSLAEREKETFCRDAYLSYVRKEIPSWFALLPERYQRQQMRTGHLPELKSIKRFEKNKDRTHLAIDYAMRKFDEALDLGDQLKNLDLRKEEAVNSAQARPFLEALFQAMEAAEGVEGKRINRTAKDVVREVGNIFRTFTVDNSRLPATDLVNSQSGDYIDPNSLVGKDTSMLNPRNSEIWKMPSRPISQFDTRNYDARNTKPGPEDLWKQADDNPLFIFDDISHGRGHNAKFHVKRLVPASDGMFLEEKYKLKFETPYERVRQQYGISKGIDVFQFHGQESMTPVAISNLASALGFAVEPTFFKKKVRVLFPPDGDEEEALQLNPGYCTAYNRGFDGRVGEAIEILNTRFGRDASTGRYVVDYSYLKRLKTRDVSGCYVLEVPTVNLTPSIGGELKTNTFTKEAYGRQFKRTYRAMQIFYALAYDIDSTDFNATVNIIGGKVVHKAADLGSTAGWFMGRDSVNDFSTNFVKRVDYADPAKKIPARVVFTYRSLNMNPISRMVTLDDAKWFARLAGQLSGEQIRQAFLGAGYAEDIANEYAYRMVKRINGLISAVGVAGTQTIDADGKPFTITLLKEPGAPSNGHFAIPEFKQCFDSNKKRFTCIPDQVRNVLRPGELSPDSRQIEGRSALSGELISVAKNNAAEVIGHQLLGRIDQIQLNNSRILTAQRDSRAGSIIRVRPVHLTIPNPFADPDAPAWSVDIFSLRIGAQALSEPDANALGLTKATLGSGAFIGRNVIHIHPTQNALRKQLELYRVALRVNDLNPFHKLSRKSLEMMVPGDIVVMVDQLGVVGSTPSAFTTPIGLAGNAGIKWTNLRQFVAMKPGNGAMAVSWLDGNATELTANFGQIPFLAPFISAVFKRLKTTQNNFYFDDWGTSSEAFRDQAVARFANSAPPSADDPLLGKYLYQKRDFKRRAKSWAWSILGLKGKRSSHEKIISTVYKTDGRNDIVDSQILSSIRLRGQREDITLRTLTEDLFRVQSAVLDNGNPVLRINTDYARMDGRLKDFEYLRARHLRFLPGGWIQFDPMSKRESFVALEFHSEYLITEQGFRNIFDKSRNTDKKVLYKALLEYISTDDLPRYKASGDSANLFAQRLEKVVAAYSSVLENRSDSNIETLNDAMTNLLYVKQFSYAGLKYLLDMAGEENYFVHARLYKDPGFPNGDSYLVLPEKYSGKLAQTAAGKAQIAKMMDVFRYSLTSFDVMMASLYRYLVNYLPSQDFSASEDWNRYSVPREFPIITPPKTRQTGLTTTSTAIPVPASPDPVQ